jgi:membrane associated rhomboid family serine protease
VLFQYGYFLVWRAGVARIRAWFFLGLWVLLQLGGGVLATSMAVSAGQSMGGVGYWAHIGGFAAGMIGAWVLALPGRIRRHDLLAGRGAEA